MADLSFDDLIPSSEGRPSADVSFSDLVPEKGIAQKAGEAALTFARSAYEAIPFRKDVSAIRQRGDETRAAFRKAVAEFGEEEAKRRLYAGELSPDFADVKRRREAESAAMAAESPIAATTGTILGAVATPVPYGLAARGTTALGRTGLGAIEGAGVAGLTGLGEGVTLEERLKSGALGSLIGGGVGGVFGRFMGPSQRVGQAAPESVQAAERLGVELPYYAVTESPMLQRATRIAENVPFAGEAAMLARQRATASLEDAIDNFVPKMTTEESGRKIGEQIKGWMTKGVRDKADEAYTEVRSLFTNPDITAPLNNTRNAIADVMAQRVEAKLKGSTPAIDLLLPAVQSNEGLTYQGAKTLYTELRNLRSENMIKGVKDTNVDILYNALRNDVLDIAEAAGGEPARYFLQKADREYRAMSNMREKLQKIVGKTDEAVSDEQIFTRLYNAARTGGSANNKLLQRAITVMDPQGLKSFQAGILAKMGRDAEGNFSPDRWLGPQGISGLSQRGRAMIFKDEPELLRSLNDVTEISRRFKNLNKFGNPSGTGQTLLGGASIAGLFADPVTTLSSVAGGNIFTRIMSKPATAESVANWSRRYENYVRNPGVVTARALYQAGIPLNRMLSEESGQDVDVNEALKLNP